MATVLEFARRTSDPMLIACLWSRWTKSNDLLLSFAAITDDPEPEVAAAEHNRPIININPGCMMIQDGGFVQTQQRSELNC